MFQLKRVGSYDFLYVMATEHEYGRALKSTITPLNCGVGPVEAAITVSAALAGEAKPDLVVSLGSAGSNRLIQGHVYQASSVSYRDMDASALGFQPGQTPFLEVPAIVELFAPLPGVERASLSTGANIVSGEDYQKIDTDMVDMETWSIMRVCQNQQIPLIGLRGISDGAAPVAEISDWTRYLELIDERLALTVSLLEHGVKDGSIKLPD